MVTKKILDGRKIIENYRVEHAKLYLSKLSRKELTSNHETIKKKLVQNLRDIGYKDAEDLKIKSEVEELAEDENKELGDCWR
tara:strand:+ start:47 stop:292 length:246 start_codon:yes stop_codon:yes gene_type:complete